MTDLKDTAKDLKTTAKDTASELGDQARAALDTGKAEASLRIEEVKDGLARQVKDAAGALRRAAADQQGTVPARVLETLASSVEGSADRLSGRSFSSLASEAAMIARRHPGALVAGAVLAGFAATRFARASAPDLPPRPAPTASAAYGQAAQGAQASQPPYLPQVPANDDLKAQATP